MASSWCSWRYSFLCLLKFAFTGNRFLQLLLHIPVLWELPWKTLPFPIGRHVMPDSFSLLWSYESLMISGKLYHWDNFQYSVTVHHPSINYSRKTQQKLFLYPLCVCQYYVLCIMENVIYFLPLFLQLQMRTLLSGFISYFCGYDKSTMA